MEETAPRKRGRKWKGSRHLLGIQRHLPEATRRKLSETAQKLANLTPEEKEAYRAHKKALEEAERENAARKLAEERRQKKIENGIKRFHERRKKRKAAKAKRKESASVLSHREEWFCRFFVATRDSRQALELAGYKTASNWSKTILRRPRIQRRIAALEASAVRRCKMNAEKIVANLERFANRAPEGDSGNDRNTIQANIELGKMLKLYTEQVQISGGESGKGMSLKDLDLPIEMQKILLERMRKIREQKEAAAQVIEGDE